MARNGLFLVVLAFVLAGCVTNVDKSTRIVNSEEDSTNASVCTDSGRKMLRHVVLFKFKDGTSDEDVKRIVDAFVALPGKVDAIADLEWGTNNSVEDLSQGFTHCFFVSFKSEADRAKYLPHPDHKAFGGILGPHLDKVLVIDYWAK
ncbi:MAG: Dabb family protein [Sedimentisphaerales bacterium]|nr:Dabb family protein [Sedimentisphaerales bacterium]